MVTSIPRIPESFEKEPGKAVQFLSAKLYESQKVSLAQAATMSNINKWDFPEILAKFDVPYFQYSSDNFLAEFDK